MATDPVERIRAYTHETPLALDLTSTLFQLAAAPLGEPLLLDIGEAFQRATDWHRRLPPNYLWKIRDE